MEAKIGTCELEYLDCFYKIHYYFFLGGGAFPLVYSRFLRCFHICFLCFWISEIPLCRCRGQTCNLRRSQPGIMGMATNACERRTSPDCNQAWILIYNYLENIGKYHFFRQLWLVLGVKLMEIHSNLFSRYICI